MKNPNHFGSVTMLSGNRRRPYMVREGRSGRQMVIGFAATRAEGIMLLSDYNKTPWSPAISNMTLEELYRSWLKLKAPRLGTHNFNGLRSAYKHIQHLNKLPYRSIRLQQMQDSIDNCGLSYSTQSAIKNLWGHLDRYAYELDIIAKQYSPLLTSAQIPVTSKTAFTEEEIERLWNNVDIPNVDMVLIFLYTGFRISELIGMKVKNIDLDVGYMRGGVKTQAGKNRIVPIHHRIRPLIERRIAETTGEYLLDHHGTKHTDSSCRRRWTKVMLRMDMCHTPHEARHTFRSRLDSAGGNRVCIDRIMGHKSQSVGESVYTHKTIRELRETIELIQ